MGRRGPMMNEPSECGRCVAIARLFGEKPGQVIVWVAVMLPLFLSVVGLAVDAGSVFAGRRELQNTADGAARAGAGQIDVNAYRQSSDGALVLDGARARQAAADYLAHETSTATAV